MQISGKRDASPTDCDIAHDSQHQQGEHNGPVRNTENQGQDTKRTLRLRVYVAEFGIITEFVYDNHNAILSGGLTAKAPSPRSVFDTQELFS